MQASRFLRCAFVISSFFAFLILAIPSTLHAQTNSGTVQGTVVDPSKAAVPGAKVRLENPVSGHVNEVETGTDGSFRVANIPLNPYHLTVTAPGFNNFAQDVDVRSTVPITLDIGLTLGAAATNITVTESASDLLEVTPTEHTDVDRQLFDQLPLESPSSSVSSLITLASPGVVADSNGLFHGLGDHAENSFSVDGQPITDQQSKVFSNQIPADSIQSMEVIEGAPPAEYGGKTSVVINVTTRSGLGQTQPHGSATESYGSFGTESPAFDLAFGSQKWGNFIAANGLTTDRFLDPPEHTAYHDNGNEENIFDRADYKLTDADSFQLNMQYTRSRFQTPDSLDQLNVGATDPFTGNPLGEASQSSYIRTLNFSPSWTRVLSTASVFTLGAFVRQDVYTYYPSADPFADFTPFVQSESISQNRKLTNVGARTAWSYVKGIHNLKIGATYQQTYLDEIDRLGIVDPGFLSMLTDSNNNSCVDSSGNPIAAPCTDLAPYDLTRGAGSGFFTFNGHTDVKEFALYAQDAITVKNWTFNIGLREDVYRGLARQSQLEPRAGIAYSIKLTNTVLRLSYARTLESPFNENLILSSTGCENVVLVQLLACSSQGPTILNPGWRNEFHAGLQQAFGKHFVLSGDYIWKYTHNAYDFSVLGNTPITFPIAWTHSKIPGFTVQGNVPDFHGFTAFVVLAHVAARFFNPQIGGAGATPGPAGAVFRIDHDENFEQTTHIQYQPFKRGPWLGFNWRYDSGLVAGPVPCAGGNCNNGPNGSDSVVDTSIISADQQFQAGLSCNGIAATPTTPLSSSLGVNLCPASEYTSKFIKIPAAGTEDDDHNPPRILPRHLFDLAVGQDDLFHNSDRYKWSLRLTVINLANKEALYNFISTFSGTHYVTPRTVTGEVGFHF